MSFILFSKVYVINVFTIKSAQLIVFTYLAIMLTKKFNRGRGSLGCLPILICFFTVVNGIFAMVRVAALFPVFGMFESYNVSVFSYFMEDSTFYLAMWLFGMKLFEVSLDMERMQNKHLEASNSLAHFASLRQREREKSKKKFHKIRILGSVIIAVVHVPILIAKVRNTIFEASSGIFAGLTLTVLALLVLIIATFLTSALWKSTRVLARSPVNSELNTCLIGVQIFTVLFWAAASICLAAVFFVHFETLFSYRNMLTISICDLSSINANFVNFIIMGLVLHKSQKVAKLRHRWRLKQTKPSPPYSIRNAASRNRVGSSLLPETTDSS